MAAFEVRRAGPQDSREMAELFAEVAAERDGIASEPPVDIEQRAAQFALSVAHTVVAVAGGRGGQGGHLVGMIHLEATRHGFGDLGMLVRQGWRGRGIGSALLAAAEDLARDLGLHKMSLEVFAHNDAAIALYRKCGFTQEGRRVRQYRRVSGEQWDTIVMGRLL
jgi:RimJ/RimL family protein N-acetyltransferase